MRAPDDPASPPPRRRRRLAIVLAAMLAALVGIAGYLSYSPEEGRFAMGRLIRSLPLAFALSGGASHPAGAVPPASLPPAPPMQIGMNPPGMASYETTAAFANLVTGEPWITGKGVALGAENADVQGNLLSSPVGSDALRPVRTPTTGPGGVTITCTWEGSATVDIALEGATGKAVQRNSLRYHIVNTWQGHVGSYLIFRDVDPKRPVRNLDCREEGTPRTALFRPHYLETMTGYAALRFMDWQNTNGNVAVKWADRHLPNGIDVYNRDGVAIENMLELARITNSDPWFCMPWNADRDYIHNFAKLVHDRLPAGRRVYVEAANEVWNSAFPVSRQAEQEGLAEGLSKDPGEAKMRRYGERTTEVMKIWEEAFPDRNRLVRVLATQHTWAPTAVTALTFRDTAAHIDAIATAPYFGDPIGGVKDGPGVKDDIFAKYRAAVATTMTQARAYRALAIKYNKRYISYEGGQSMVLFGAKDLMRDIQHDQRMYEVYKIFLQGWRHDIGDLLTLLTSAAPLGEAAWGLADYEGQPLSDAPKLRAVLEERGH